MKILVIKFNPSVIRVLDNLQHEVVAICDPDLNGRVLAQHERPWTKCYADTSLAIRESGCDTVLLTISDHAAQLALLAMAYKKSILLSREMKWNEQDTEKIATLALRAGIRIGAI